MRTWAIIWGIMILLGVAGMIIGARYMWGLVFLAAIMLCGALAEIDTEKQKESHGRRR